MTVIFHTQRESYKNVDYLMHCYTGNHSFQCPQTHQDECDVAASICQASVKQLIQVILPTIKKKKKKKERKKHKNAVTVT